MGDNTLKLGTVHQCNCCMGGKTLHPLISVIDLSKAHLSPYTDIKVGFYAVLISEWEIECKCEAHAYGQQYYDYSDATVFCLSPGETINLNEDNRKLPSKGWMLAFHPDLICGTSLGMGIEDYSFFSYHPEEALHLSLREKQMLLDLLDKINLEVQRYIDCHSKKITSKYIELVLDYCTRFYERQFITRNEVNKNVIKQFDKLLNEYFDTTNQLHTAEAPTAKHYADVLHLSSEYFTDLLRFETGKSFKEYVQLKRFDVAKKWLMETDKSIHQIANELGFQNVQYFSRLFKKITGHTPNVCRMLN